MRNDPDLIKFTHHIIFDRKSTSKDMRKVVSEMKEETEYDLQGGTGRANPVVRGTVLQMVALLARSPLTKDVLRKHIKKINEFDQFTELASILPDVPVFFPFVTPLLPPRPGQRKLSLVDFITPKAKDNDDDIEELKSGFKYHSIADYRAKYLSGELTPLQVAQVILLILETQDDKLLRAFVSINKTQVMQAAQESTKRYQDGKSLGVLDGVPVAIKDEVDVAGHKTCVGTNFLGDLEGVKSRDEVAVQRMRDAGALIIGKTNMVELGMGVTGYNMHFGTPRNPHNPNHYTGGSSSGSAAAVAAGIVPLALGVDGGGSVRIPASFCGIVGLKPTFGRVAKLSNAAPSVCHIGPLAASVQDAAIGYAVMSGGHASFPPSLLQPEVDLSSFDDIARLEGLRIGVFDAYMDDCHDEVKSAVRDTIQQLVQKGAQVVHVHLNHLLAIRMAHAATILSEIARSVHKHKQFFKQISPEVQINLGIAEVLSAPEYVSCQKVRSFAMRQCEELFKQCDVFVSPMTSVTAPEIHRHALHKGESNVDLMKEATRFAFLGNLVGIPGIAVPIGFDATGLPISIQLQTAHWNENLALRVAHAIEELVAARANRKPTIYFDIMKLAMEQKQ